MSPPYADDVDALDVEADDGASAPAPAPAAPARPTAGPSAPRSPDAINADIEAMRKEHDATGRWGDAEHARMKALLDEQLAVQDGERPGATPGVASTPAEVAEFLDALPLPAGESWKPAVVTKLAATAAEYGVEDEISEALGAFRAARHAPQTYTNAEIRRMLSASGDPDEIDHYAEVALTFAHSAGHTEALADLERTGMDRDPQVRVALAKIARKLLEHESVMAWHLASQEDTR